MDSKLSEQLLEWAKQAVEAGTTYIPQLVQQYLTWYLWMHVFWLCAGALFLIVGAVSLYKENKSDDPWGVPSVYGILGILGMASGPIITLGNIYYLIQIKVAPAVYIISEFASR